MDKPNNYLLKEVTVKMIFMCFIIIFISVISISCSTNQYIKSNEYNFHIKSIETRSLLGLLADLSDVNIIVGDELKNKRVKLYSEEVSASDLLFQIVEYDGLVYKKYKDILMVASECRLKNNHGLGVSERYNKKLSLNFPKGTSTGHIFELLSEFTGDHIELSGNVKNSSIMIRVKKQDVDDLIFVISAVEGFSLSNSSQGEIAITSDPGITTCTGRKLAVSKNIPIEMRESAFKECVHNVNGKVKKRVCEPAERYELKNIKAIGYVENAKNKDRQVIIELPDSVSRLSIGNHMGRNNGVIYRITKEGIYISELVKERNVYKIFKNYLHY